MEPTDRTLLIRAASGEEAAFARLYERYARRLKAYFYVYCSTDEGTADDLCQELFLNLLNSKAFSEPHRGPDDLSPLLFSIAANLRKNYFRAEDRRVRRLRTYRERQEAKQPVNLCEFEQDPSLQHALDQLSEDHRRCVVLRFKRGLSVAEIAQILDCPPGTVKSRLHYGLKKMAETLPKNLLHDY
ncbi:MAG: RNA polymerase sigma factor [Bacteroidota bacterium]